MHNVSIPRRSYFGQYLGVGLYHEAIEAFRSGDNERARQLSREVLASARSAGDAEGQVDGLCMLSRVALREQRINEVEEHARAAREVASASGEPRLEQMPLHMLAVSARMGGKPAIARRLYERSIALNRSLGEDRMVAGEFRNLAYVELRDGNLARARELFQRARAEAVGLEFRGLFPYLVADRAVLAAEDGNFVQSATLLGSAQAAFDASGQVPDPDDAVEHEELLQDLGLELGEDRLLALLEAGAALAIDDALIAD